jgi:dipeptidyl-peptidase 4
MKGRLACAVLVLASSELMNGSRVSAEDAQVPAAVYARAEAVIPQHIGRLIYGTSVRPQWIGETSRFQFEKRTPAGREYWVVDAVAGTMQPLFDHAALINTLAAATGKAVDRKKFRLTELGVDAGSRALRFQQEGKGWQYDPKSNALTAYNAPADKGLASPDGAWRAFVRDGNLFVVSVNDGREKQLTTDGTVDAPYATPVMDPKTMIAQGTATPVVEPALSWSPDSRRIATFHLSQEGARRLAIVQSTPPDGANPRMFEYLYPLPGDIAVPLANGVFFDVQTGKRVDMALAAEPMLYYLAPEFTWTADSKAVLERVTERGYKALQLYRVEAATGAASLLSEDRSDTYVDFWSHSWSYDDKSDTVYWTADNTGFLQTYAIDARTGARRQITSGDWRVASIAGVDQSAGKLLIVGTGREAGRDPYLRHLYAVPKKGGALQLLTPEPLDHDVSVSPDGRYFVDNMSLINVPTRSVLRRSSDGRSVRELGRADITAFIAAGYRLPEPFEALAADGQTPIYGAIFKPADFDPGQRYPIIEEMYTGPQIVSMTAKSFEAGLLSRGQNSLAQLGVIALTIDGRGVAGRSRAFQQPSYKNLHAVGLDDHIAGIRALAAKNAWMDVSRVGIHGYSAGGYDVVKAMTERPDFYKVGLSASGVQDNRLDKAWWNEQWMGDKLGPLFDANSNITWASKLTGKLFVVHGELDENVPLANSLRLVDALMKANKDFELLIVPNAFHPVEAVPYFHRRRWDFFVRELLGKMPPAAYQMEPFE